jgi:hypothetical protein
MISAHGTEIRRPNESWKEEMMTAMQSRGFNIEDAQDRRLWRIGTGRQPQIIPTYRLVTQC